MGIDIITVENALKGAEYEGLSVSRPCLGILDYSCIITSYGQICVSSSPGIPESINRAIVLVPAYNNNKCPHYEWIYMRIIEE